MKIGVFDSGLGGLSVANAIEKAFPAHEVIFRNDSKHVPYGTKKPSVIQDFVEPILKSLVEEGCSVIVVACNTVSTTLIEELRKNINIPLVAIEPMIKPAAKLTESNIIAVCATPTTLASDRYKWLKNEYAKGVKVLEPDCSTWSRMIEDKKIDEAIIADEINDVIQLGADVIVLGCTHYHWIEDHITAVAGEKAKVLQPEQAIIKEVRRQLAKLA
jgi:glutamate racemase